MTFILTTKRMIAPNATSRISFVSLPPKKMFKTARKQSYEGLSLLLEEQVSLKDGSILDIVFAMNASEGTARLSLSEWENANKSKHDTEKNGTSLLKMTISPPAK